MFTPNDTPKEVMKTYDQIWVISGSVCEVPEATYASRLMPGYTTRGVTGIEGICLLKTLTVNFEFARMVSACPTA